MITKELTSLYNKDKADILQRFFKTEPGQYGAGDVFLGITVPQQRLIARKYVKLGLEEIRMLLRSKIHELRLTALLILVEQYENAKDWKIKKKIVSFYLKNTARINNWDLVDLSVYKILGNYLRETGADKRLLIKLAGSKNLWERRMAMVATYAFIKSGSSKETLIIARILLRDNHDLIQKAVGWMLRETGKRIDEKILIEFLNKNYKVMPRVALRYAIERLRPAEREYYLGKRTKSRE